MKPKILFVHNYYREFGGEDSNIQDELKFFKDNYEIKLFSADNSTRLKVFEFFAFLFRTNFQINKRFKKEISSYKPDIVYIHNTWFKINLGIYKILSKKNIKTLIKVHSFRYECGRYFMSKNHLNGSVHCNACGFKNKRFQIFNKYYSDSYLKSIFLIHYSKKYIKILKNRNFKIASISHFQEKQLIDSGVSSQCLNIINNPINFIEVSKSVTKNYILYAGRISKEKGVEELIKAWLKSELVNYELIIVGDGSCRENLMKKYSHINLKFLGHIDNKEVIDLIKYAKAVVTATKLFEGQPRILCEASSMKTVSIYPSFGGMDEFFPPKYPFSFKQYDYDDLTKKLNLVLNQEIIDEYSNDVFKFITEKLNKTKILNEFDNLIKS